MNRIALLLFALICTEAAADVDGGIAAYKRGEFAAAFAEFSVAAGKDDPFAQNVLGTMYVQGRGVRQDYKLAMDWFYKAQILGFPEAMANLAKMYAQGLGVPQNNAAALQYYREAAFAGFQPAILRMAEIYEKGELGVAPDATLALAWRVRLRGGPVEASKVRVMPATAVATEDQSGVRKAPAASLPKPASKDQAVPAPVDNGALFEKQVFKRLENNRPRARKLFVASTDNTPSLAGYLKELRTQLGSLLAPAFSASKPDERMIVTLTIPRDGTLTDIELSQGSGNPKTDRRVLSSLKKLTRLRPLPAEIEGGADTLVVSVGLPIE
ncbi:MAG: TonB C-terminal domain-containing protein [Sterolibacterium sp.]|nr:TonB C-terminal domain-containing protein [Sterolibacterium sp.]